MFTLPQLPPLAVSNMGRLRLDTLVRLRWLAVAGQTASILLVRYGLGFTLPLLPCFVVIFALVMANLASRYVFPATMRLSGRMALAYLSFDIIQLAALLYLTGGLGNPFAFLFLVPVMVSASSLHPSQTLLLGFLTLASAAVIAIWHLPLPWSPGEVYQPATLFVLGAWFSLAASMVFMGLHVSRIARESQQLSDALTATELALVHEQHLSQLDGLAAAAAHELGTPLATIALIAKDLEGDPALTADHGADLALLREQILRCRDIMSKLTSLGASDNEPFHRLTLSHLLENIVEPHRHFGVQVTVECRGSGPEPIGRRDPAILYGLGNLIENAIDFAHDTVRIDARWSERQISVLIIDDGPGIRADILTRLGEPYVSGRSKDSGGLGLGFFIAKRLIERSGGRIALANRPPPDHGAQLKIDWMRADFEKDEITSTYANA